VTRPTRIKGIAASIGIAVGAARFLGRRGRRASYRRIQDSEVSTELARFAEAVSRSNAEIEEAKRELLRLQGSKQVPILDVYLLMHGDALLIDAISDAIRNDGINAELAVSRVAERLRAPLLQDASSYFRERARDITHLEDHLLRHLCGERRPEACSEGPVVLIAPDLSPADAVRALAPPTVGLVTEIGAASSHTAILARTFGIPAVVGVGPLSIEIEDDEIVVVDGFSGEVTLGASAEERAQAEARRNRFAVFLQADRAPRAVTLDGTSITVSANVGLASELKAVIETRADGIGLYRTELMCIDRTGPPPEDEQFESYRTVVTALAPKKVVFRTFDWRGDKRLRAHDLSEREHSWLKAQIRAVLRASSEGSVALMFPMVATLDELIQAKALVDACRSELNDEAAGSAILPIGMMVEVPSAALLAERFARHADFFAVGTNDLACSTLALDRNASNRSGAPAALDPAVLRLLDHALCAARDANIPCSMCGDMACDPVALCVALGLGYRHVSVPVSVVPLARALIRNLDLQIAEDLAREALECPSAVAVRNLAVDRLGEHIGPSLRDQGLL
jgi:phosphotransferase system enzyme I (PtsI)